MLTRIAVVSLARAKDRRQNVLSQKTWVKYPHEVVDAVDGAQLDVPSLKMAGLVTRDDWHDREFLPGELACTFSHKKVWASVEPQEFVLILEDDLLLSRDFNDRMLAIDAQIRSNGVRPDLIVMHSHQGPGRAGRVKISQDLYRSEWECGGTAAYAISYKAARKFMDGSRTIDTMTDGFLNRVSKVVETYVVMPFIGCIGFHSVIGVGKERTFKS